MGRFWGRSSPRAPTFFFFIFLFLLQTALTAAQNRGRACVYDSSNDVTSNLKYCGYEFFCDAAGVCVNCFKPSVSNQTCYLPMNTCNIEDGRCSHSDILQALDDRNLKNVVGASIITFLVGILASGTGLGGGAVIIPILVIICSFEAPQAAPVSKAYLFGCSVVNIASYLKQRHPLSPARPLIDYHLAFVLLPLQLIGSQVGVLFNSFLPSYILVAGIALTLGYAICKMAQKFRHSRATKNNGQTSSQFSLTEPFTSSPLVELSHTNSPAHHAPAADSTLQQQQHFK
jgi:hypothetical protein